jgi:hypothetical protein
MSRIGSCARREAIILSVESDHITDSTASGAPNPDGTSVDWTEEAHPLQAGAPVLPESPTFAELGVRPEIVAALAEAGIERTFAIQELTLPLALAGEDVIGQARTGMGKTLGFGVPLLQRVTPPAEQPAADVHGDAADRTKDVPQALVVVPTRELCVQVAKDLADAGAKLGVRVTACWTSPSSATSCSAASRRWSWTRPTRCWTSGSCPTSSGSCGCCPSSGTRCCSRPRCPARSSRSPARS